MKIASRSLTLQNRILAHRGFWVKAIDKNTKGALQQAFENGFGIETDIRDGCSHDVIIAHDPRYLRNHQDEIPIDWLFEVAQTHKDSSCLALNIKCDGIIPLLLKKLERYDIQNYFIFDMSLPDNFSTYKLPINKYDRLSKYEKQLSNSPSVVSGYWVDCYDNTFPTLNDINELIASDYKLAFVSPELHGRDHVEVWHNLKRNSFLKNTNLSLCTDFPQQALDFFTS